jgi:hypothetical protein
MQSKFELGDGLSVHCYVMPSTSGIIYLVIFTFKARVKMHSKSDKLKCFKEIREFVGDE